MAPKRGLDSLLEPFHKRLKASAGLISHSVASDFTILSDEVVLLIFSNLMDFRDLVICSQGPPKSAAARGFKTFLSEMGGGIRPARKGDQAITYEGEAKLGTDRVSAFQVDVQVNNIALAIRPRFSRTALNSSSHVPPSRLSRNWRIGRCIRESIPGGFGDRSTSRHCTFRSQNLVVAGEAIISTFGPDLVITRLDESPHRIHSSQEIACIALDHSTTTNTSPAHHTADTRVACFLIDGSFTVYSVPDSNLARTSVLHSLQSPSRSNANEAREAVYKHPLVITISADSELAIWDVRTPPRPIYRLRSYTSFPPLSLSLSSTANAWKLLVAHCAPVYPSHWLPSASELTLVEEAGRFKVTGSRKTPSLAASTGWIDEQECREMELEWSRKLGRVEIVETDGKFLVVAGVDNVLQIYRIHYKPQFRLSYIGTLNGHTFGVSALKVADGRCVSVGKEGTLRIWDLEAGWTSEVVDAIARPDGNLPNIRGLAFDERRAIAMDACVEEHSTVLFVWTLEVVCLRVTILGFAFRLATFGSSLPYSDSLQTPRSTLVFDSTSGLDHDYTPQTGKNQNAYKIRRALKPPLTGTYAAESIYRWIDQGRIDLEPSYARCISDKVEDEDGNVLRVCIDGKQRLTSIQHFMDGVIPHIDNETKKKYYYKATDRKRTLLPEAIRNDFREKQIVCIEYEHLTNTQEREIFQASLSRVQLGMPLKPAERMAAIAGPWAAFVLEVKSKYLPDLADKETPATGFLKHISVAVDRGSDFLAVAQLIYGLDRSPGRATFSSVDVEKWLKRVDPPSKDFKTRTYGVFSKYLKVVSSWDKPRVAPVEFVMIGVLIGRLLDDPVDLLDQHIQNFRKSMKTAHVDLRLNTKVLKSAYDIIDSTVSTKKGGKRTKGDSDDEDEYRGSPMAKKTKAVPTRLQAAAASSSRVSDSLPRSPSTNTTQRGSSSNTSAGPSSTSMNTRPSSRPISPVKDVNKPSSSSTANMPTETDTKPNLDTLKFLELYKERKRSNSQNGASTPTPSTSVPRGPQGGQDQGVPRQTPTQGGNMMQSSSNLVTPVGTSFTPAPVPGFTSHLASFFNTSQPSLQVQSVQPQPYGFGQPQSVTGMSQQQHLGHPSQFQPHSQQHSQQHSGDPRLQHQNGYRS
ncbi:hypothetical protein FRB97_005483 [Tulasnella sp. 331]|nr:hypothetical protein FRB97_005483 [Tulasnella sp. 331]